MAQVHQLALTALTDHSFKSDRSEVAVCSNSNEVQIYETKNWTLTETLKEHDKLVTSIDWAPNTNRIVTCSQDRNAYVWNLAQDPQTGSPIWKPTLVLLRLNRSATQVKWAPSETKFAVASGARTIAVCSYDDESNWWVARHIKKPIRSTVLSIDWHPNDVLLAAGSADCKARVFSAFLKGDAKPPASGWGSKLPFNTVCAEYASPAGGWVHSVAFSPSGDFLAFCAHDSTVTIAYPAGEGQPPAAVFTIRGATLPYVSLLFASESCLIAAGHDCEPVVFEGDGQGWQLTRSLDDPANRSQASGTPGSKVGSSGIGRLNNEAFNRFKAADSRGINSHATASPPGTPVIGAKFTNVGGSTERTSVHQNTITSLRPYEGQREGLIKVSTSGVDGRLVVWPVTAGGVGGLTSGLNRVGLHQ